MNSYSQKIQQDNPTAHAALQRVAAKIYEEASNSIQLDQGDGIGVEEAIGLGFLSQEEEKLFFPNPEILKDYLVHHAASLMERAWSNVEELVDIHKKTERLSLRVSSVNNLENEVLLMLAQEYGKDLAECVVEASVLRNSEKSRYSFQGLYNCFWEILPQLDVEAEAIISVLDAMGVDFDEGNFAIYAAIEEISARGRDIADTLYNSLMSRASMPAAGLIFNTLKAIAITDLPEAHKRALALSDRVELILRRVGIRALGNFNYENDESKTLLRSTLNRFQILRSASNPETDAMLVMSYEYLVKHTDEVQSIFAELVVDSNPVIWKTALSSLFQLARQAYTQEWYQQALMRLIEAQSFSLEELRTLDHCIEQYIKAQPDFALQLVEAIAAHWYFEHHEGNERLVEGLNQIFYGLRNLQRKTLIFSFTRWVASREQYLHFIAFELNNYFTSIPVKVGDRLERAKNPTLVLSKEVLDTLDEETTSFALCRIVGYVIDAFSLCALLLSALQREPASQLIIDLVTNLLTSYVLFNYPGEAGEYLKDRAKADDVTEIETKVIQEALSQSQSYLENRTKLSRLREFQPSSQRTYLYRLAKWKQQKGIIEQVEEQSILKIIPSVLFLYGKATAMERDGQFTDPTPFVPISASTEIPQGELIDPVGQAYLRRQWQYAGLSTTDKETDQQNETSH
ncbi:hypothetical protein [Microcoleus sp. FACHB-672]|uniref:hypothetical protein n=1 Tax=Microcoleus sp. FACHB-672 TaxID=2692825 RepID=UPI0016848971|nr:hypothetical protein [Microcoleus sp. FACHB-672]MBD2043244.1 hypothetical protein [Microcoleus sp. FACHB-672]